MTKRELTARLLNAVSAAESGVRPTDPVLPREGRGAVKPALESAPANDGAVRLTLVIEGPGEEALRTLVRAMVNAGVRVTVGTDVPSAVTGVPAPKPPKGGRTVITKRDVIAWKKAGRIPQIPPDAIITAYARDEARRLGIELPRKR